MIIYELIQALKNVIFKKIIFISCITLLLCYIINSAKEELFITEVTLQKLQKATSNLSAQIEALNQKDSLMTETIESYKYLTNQGLQDVKEGSGLLNKEEYIYRIKDISREFKFNDPAIINISSDNISEKTLTKKTISLSSSNISVKAQLNDIENAVIFAQKIYDALPLYNVMCKLKIEKNDIITPVILEELDSPGSINLISLTTNMQVKTIKLNGQQP
ncbi:MAG: hypothetical protein SFT93_05755 [Rickettsiaceae bacterium]|nr:hypothetical protein [Rickettsiaceae bacterium]